MGKYIDVEMRSEEYKEKLKCAKLGKKFTDKHKQNIGKSRKGIKREKFTEEHRKNIGKARKGMKFTDEHCENIKKNHKGNLGKKLSDKTKLKISNTLKGRKLSKEIKKKIGDGNKGKKISDEHKQKIGNANRGREFTEKHKKNMRLSRIKDIEKKKGQLSPNYNPNACIFFDKLNKTLGWNGQHAENMNEYYIKELGYFVDFYEPNLNLVIEYDEKSHYNSDGTLKEKDKIRENEIKNFLNCKFIRIREFDFKNIDKIISLIKGYV